MIQVMMVVFICEEQKFFNPSSPERDAIPAGIVCLELVN